MTNEIAIYLQDWSTYFVLSLVAGSVSGLIRLIFK